jgi:hypothetical protein
MPGPDPGICISAHDRTLTSRQPIRAEGDPRVEPEDDAGVLEDDAGVLEEGTRVPLSAVIELLPTGGDGRPVGMFGMAQMAPDFEIRYVSASKAMITIVSFVLVSMTYSVFDLTTWNSNILERSIVERMQHLDH